MALLTPLYYCLWFLPQCLWYCTARDSCFHILLPFAASILSRLTTMNFDEAYLACCRLLACRTGLPWY
jgi:hypothetical protein